MVQSSPTVIRLVDLPEEAGRTTATLLSSLAMRLVTLHYTSGVSVIGSIIAGLSEAGREFRGTVEGRRFLRAFDKAGITKNGELIWESLRIADWARGLPPSPVLDHIRNDLALLLAEDLQEAMSAVPLPPESRYAGHQPKREDANFLDCLLGLLVYSRELTRSIEVLAEGHQEDTNTVEQHSGIRDGDAILR